MLGWAFAPLAWAAGVPWAEAQAGGALLGTKTILNELVAYSVLSSYIQDGVIAERSMVIATYALCGFANFSSIGIQIGGIGGLAPGRRSDIARLGLRAMLAGNLAAFMSATLAGMLM